MKEVLCVLKTINGELTPAFVNKRPYFIQYQHEVKKRPLH